LDSPRKMDDILYAKYLGESIGYGVFAKAEIMKNTILGEYTGVIELNPEDTNYAWSYKSYFKELGRNITINSKEEGNLLRFVNDYSTHNIKVLYVPLNNIWRIYYISTANIK